MYLSLTIQLSFLHKQPESSLGRFLFSIIQDSRVSAQILDPKAGGGNSASSNDRFPADVISGVIFQADLATTIQEEFVNFLAEHVDLVASLPEGTFGQCRTYYERWTRRPLGTDEAGVKDRTVWLSGAVDEFVTVIDALMKPKSRSVNRVTERLYDDFRSDGVWYDLSEAGTALGQESNGAEGGAQGQVKKEEYHGEAVIVEEDKHPASSNEGKLFPRFRDYLQSKRVLIGTSIKGYHGKCPTKTYHSLLQKVRTIFVLAFLFFSFPFSLTYVNFMSTRC